MPDQTTVLTVVVDSDLADRLARVAKGRHMTFVEGVEEALRVFVDLYSHCALTEHASDTIPSPAKEVG